MKQAHSTCLQSHTGSQAGQSQEASRNSSAREKISPQETDL